MKLFLIRHAESEQNAGQDCAGSTDPSLSEQGKAQIQRLADHFSSRGIRFTRVFSSDLQRARITAEGINEGQKPIQVSELREQHFDVGGGGWSALSGGYAEESESEMGDRANTFLHDHILPVLFNNKNNSPGNEETVAVVAHGVILRVLWRRLADHFNRRDIKLGPGVDASTMPSWSNTGYMELDIRPSQQQSRTAAAPSTTTNAYTPSQGLYRTSSGAKSATSMVGSAPSASTRSSASIAPAPSRGEGPPLSGWTMTVLTIDDTSHLQGDGVGTQRHDGQQRQQQQQQQPRSTMGSYQFPGISETVNLPGAANAYY
ncbi:hypothetical protein VTN00DRAFT_1984 [Thermoascus crustaceus]|uniref:uncharacterized protein n=1 Tax=Thermoascus crustaceus TaxID=5088 RepID=UPI00374233EA